MCVCVRARVLGDRLITNTCELFIVVNTCVEMVSVFF